jgi:hypothetical protein
MKLGMELEVPEPSPVRRNNDRRLQVLNRPMFHPGQDKGAPNAVSH